MITPNGRAGWQSGHAADCKSVYAGSIPTLASIFPLDNIQAAGHKSPRKVFLGSSAVEQVTVNHLVGGSIPSRGAIFRYLKQHIKDSNAKKTGTNDSLAPAFKNYPSLTLKIHTHSNTTRPCIIRLRISPGVDRILQIWLHAQPRQEFIAIG